LEFFKQLSYIKKDPVWREETTLGKFLRIFIIAFGLFMIACSMISTPFYSFLIQEDGVIEYGSALFWLLAAIAMLITFIFTPNKNRVLTLWYLALFLFFVVCCGEEISWGQRLFDIQGPAFIIEINKQNELNIHDIGYISIYSNTFFLLYLAVFFVYPYKTFQSDQLKAYVTTHRLPIVSYELITIAMSVIVIWLILGIRYGTLGFHPFSIFGYHTQMDDEVFEFMAAYTYFCLAVLEMQRKLFNKTTPQPQKTM